MSAVQKVQKYTVVDSIGTVHVVEADYIFKEDGELTFRVGERGNTQITGMFARGQWISCVKDAGANG
ncbi:MAG: hypothetical protein ACTHLK_23120 [Brucella intermedia]